MAKIRNPVAFAAWLARKQMAEQQAKNVETYETQGVQGAVDQTQLIQSVMQQAAVQQSITAQKKRKRPLLGVYNDLFSGETPLPGYNDNRTAYDILNMGRKE